MTLLDTEKIGKKLVRYGYYRNPSDHHSYRTSNHPVYIKVKFSNLYSDHWYADFVFEIDGHTNVTYKGNSAVFEPEWLEEEYHKVSAIFNFLRV